MISIRTTIGNDLDDIIRIHLLSFDKSHFSANFPPKLLKSYLECLLKSCPFSFTLLSDNKVAGYIFGGLNPSVGVKDFIRKNLWEVISVFFKYPRFIKEKIIEILFDKDFKVKNSKEIPTVYIIAADPFVRIGIGIKLINSFEMKIRTENFFEYRLAVRKDNDKAIKFYERNGLHRLFTSRTSYCYSKSLR